MCHHYYEFSGQQGHIQEGKCIHCGAKQKACNSMPEQCYSNYRTLKSCIVPFAPYNNIDVLLTAPKKNRLQKGNLIDLALRDNLYQNELNEL